MADMKNGSRMAKHRVLKDLMRTMHGKIKKGYGDKKMDDAGLDKKIEDDEESAYAEDPKKNQIDCEDDCAPGEEGEPDLKDMIKSYMARHNIKAGKTVVTMRPNGDMPMSVMKRKGR